MIGLDTNILVRYLTQDDPIQSLKARVVIERQLTGENAGFASIVAMVETLWMLERAYKVTTLEIVRAVERILQTDVLVVENEQEVFTALIALKERTRLVRGRRYRSTRSQKRLFLDADV
jgi:predicted nucleic-acid-binding protein